MADKVTELAAQDAAGSDQERAALLLSARPSVLLKFEDMIAAACRRAGFAAGETYVTEVAAALKRPMTNGCVWSDGYEAARRELKALSERGR